MRFMLPCAEKMEKHTITSAKLGVKNVLPIPANAPLRPPLLLLSALLATRRKVIHAAAPTLSACQAFSTAAKMCAFATLTLTKGVPKKKCVISLQGEWVLSAMRVIARVQKFVATKVTMHLLAVTSAVNVLFPSKG